jgi:hypothetical protein
MCVYGRGRGVPRRIICPKCGAIIDLSGEKLLSMAPKKPESLEEVKALFSAGELRVLEIDETPKAYTVKPKFFLGRKVFSAISNVVELAGGHYFSAGKMSKFIIPKDQNQEGSAEPDQGEPSD